MKRSHLLLFLLTCKAYNAEITVDSTADTNTPTTLRYAIGITNASDSINFSSSLGDPVTIAGATPIQFSTTCTISGTNNVPNPITLNITTGAVTDIPVFTTNSVQVITLENISQLGTPLSGSDIYYSIQGIDNSASVIINNSIDASIPAYITGSFGNFTFLGTNTTTIAGFKLTGSNSISSFSTSSFGGPLSVINETLSTGDSGSSINGIIESGTTFSYQITTSQTHSGWTLENQGTLVFQATSLDGNPITTTLVSDINNTAGGTIQLISKQTTGTPTNIFLVTDLGGSDAANFSGSGNIEVNSGGDAALRIQLESSGLRFGTLTFTRNGDSILQAGLSSGVDFRNSGVGGVVNFGTTNSSITIQNGANGSFAVGGLVSSSGGGGFSFGQNSDVLYIGESTSNTYSFSGLFNGGGDITKQSTSTQAITASQTASWTSGVLSITGGTFTLSGPSANIGSSIGISISSGATLELSVTTGSGTVTYSLNSSIINNGTTLATMISGRTLGLSSSISGTGGVTTAGTGGILALSGTNIYQGATVIGAGTTIEAVSNSAISSESVYTINGTLLIDNPNATVPIGALNGLGAISLVASFGDIFVLQIKKGGGPYSFGGSIASTGSTLDSTTISVTGNTIQSFTANPFASSTLGTRSYTVSAGSTIDFNPTASSVSFNGSISGTGSVSKTGSNTATLTDNNTFSGTLTASAGTLILSGTNTPNSVSINGGTLNLNNAAALQSTTPVAFTSSGGTLIVSAATEIGDLADSAAANVSAITLNDTLTINTTGSSNFNGTISGTGGLTKADVSELALSGTSTYSGDTTITNGTLIINASTAFSPNSQYIVDTTLGINTTSGTIEGLNGSGAVGVNVNNATLTISAVGGSYGGTFAAISGPYSFNLSITDNANQTFSADPLWTDLLPTVSLGELSPDSDGFLTISATGTLTSFAVDMVTSTSALIFDTAAITSFGGVISGLGAIQKDGASVLTLSGINTLSGDITVNTGTLILSGTNSSVNSANINGGSLSLSSTTALSNVTSIFLDSTGDLSANAAVTVGLITSASATSTISLAGDDLTTDSGGSNSTFAGVIQGAKNLIKTGTGTFTLSGTNTASGAYSVTGGTLLLSGTNTSLTGATINGGNLTVSNGSALSSAANVAFGSTGGTFTVSNSVTIGELTDAGSGTRTVSLASGQTLTTTYTTDRTLSASTSGAGGITFTRSASNTPTVSLTGSFAHTGTTSIDTGVTVQAAASSLSSSSLLNMDGGTLTNQGANTVNGITGSSGITLSSGLSITSSTDQLYSGSFSGSGALAKAGTSTQTFSGDNSGYGGTLTISAGTISLTGAWGPAVVNNAALAISDAASTTRAFNVSGSGATTYTVAAAQSSTYSGDITGAGSFTKAGSGALTLSGANSFSGSTTISAGVLQAAASSLSSSSLLNMDGGTLTNQGANTVNGIAGSSGITLSSGLSITSSTDQTYSGSFSGSGALAKAGTSTQTFSGDNSGYGGTLTISAGTISLTGAWGPAVVNNANLAISDAASSTRAFNVSGSGATTYTVAAAQSSTYSGIISDAGSFTKLGAGTLSLSGANSFSGSTTISAGVLQAAASSLSSSSLLNMNGGTLTNQGANTVNGITGSSGITLSSGLSITSSTDQTYSGTFSGSGSLAKAGTSTQTFSGDNSGYSGTLTISAGTVGISGAWGPAVVNNAALAISDAASTTRAFNISGSGATTYTVAAAQSSTYSGIISDAGSFTKLGAGTLSLSGANSFSGSTTISAGVLQAAASSLSSSSLLNMDGGTLTNQGANTVNGITGSSGITLSSGLSITSSTDQTYSGTFSGSGSLAKAGTSTQTFSGDNSGYSGTLTISAGTAGISGAWAPAVVNNAALAISDAASTTRAFNVSGSGATTYTVAAAQSSTYSGDITGAGSFTKAGSGALTLSGSGNSFSGDTTVNGGSLTANTGALSTNSLLVLTTGSFVNSGANTVNGLTGSANATLNATLTSDSASNQAYSGVLSGAGSFVKSGSSTATLSGNNTLSGGFSVGAGTLILSGTNTSATSASISGGSLELTNTSSLTSGATVTLSGSGALVVSAANTVGSIASASSSSTITLDANLTSSTSSTTEFAGSLDGASTFIKSGSGILTFSGDNSSFAGGLTISAGTAGISGAWAPAVVNNANLAISDAASTTRAFNVSGSGATTYTVAAAQSSTYSGSISGTGSFTKVGTGTLTLSDTHSYSGSSLITAGTLGTTIANALPTTTALTIGASSTFNLGANQQLSELISAESTSVVDLNTSTLTLSGSSNATYAGRIIGSGNLIKSGTNTVTLSGEGSDTTDLGELFTGNISITSGNLIINGNFDSSPVTVNVGGTLNGTGSVGSLLVNGTLNPGNSIGTLSVIGDYTQASGSTLEIEFSADGSSDLVDITGNATISSSANLVLIPYEGDYVSNQTFTFLQTSGSVSGTFSPDLITIQNEENLLGLFLELDTYADRIDIILLGTPRVRTRSSPPAPYTDLVAMPRFLSYMMSLGSSDSLGMNRYTRIMQDRCPNSSQGSWDLSLSETMQKGQFEQNSTLPHSMYEIYTAVVETGYSIDEFSFGGFAEYGYGSLKADRSVGSIQANSFSAGIEGEYLYENTMALGAITSLGSTWYTLAHPNHTAQTTGWQYIAQIYLNGSLCVGKHQFTPEGSVEYLLSSIQGYTEEGSGILTVVKKDDYHVWTADLGITWSYSLQAFSWNLLPHLTVRESWVLNSTNSHVGTSVYASTSTLYAPIPAFDNHYTQLGAGLSAEKGNCSLTLDGFRYFFPKQEGSWAARIAFQVKF